MSKALWMQGALALMLPLITSALAFGIAARGEFASKCLRPGNLVTPASASSS